MVGDDFHVSAIVGAHNMETDAEEFGIDAAWLQNEGRSGKGGDPAAVVLNSQHVNSWSLAFPKPIVCPTWLNLLQKTLQLAS